MGDRVAVMRKGEIQQVDDPQELYDRPLNLFVGGFIGSPAMNMIEATIEQANGGLTANAGSQSIELGNETLSARPGLKEYAGKHVILGIRPEDLEDAALESDIPPNRCLSGEVELREALGAEIMAHFSIEAKAAETEETQELARDTGAPETGADITTPEGKTVLVGRFGARSRVREGEQVKVAVDTRALHFFDPETGLGIYDGNEKGDAA
jgi:multiple sugar transport system ATP-binding protein